MSKTQNWILILSILTFSQTVSCSPPSIVQGSNETLKFRLNYSFFKFFSQNGHRVVDREIPKITIPNISLPFSTAVGSGVVVTSELVIQKFQTPNIDFSLSKTGISWSTSFGAAKLIGKWGASFTEFITVKDSGWLNVVASDIRMNISASATELDGQPQIEIGACEVDIIHMDVQIGGSVLSYLVNLFRGPLSSLVKSLIHSQACVAASGILLTEANRFLHSLPSHIDIGKNFYVDYYLTQNPTSFDEGVDIDLAADVVYGQSSCHPWKVMNWTDAGAHAGMVTLWVSKSIPNCLLESAHKNRLVKIVVSKNSQLVEPYLKTSCGIFSICIGKFFTKLRQNYPNQYVDLVFSTYLTPFLSMSESDGLELIMSFTVDFYINPYQEKSTEDTLARLIVDTSSDVRPYLNNSRISGDLQNCTIRVREQFSNIGDFSEIFLRTFSNILSVTAKEAVKKVLKVGIPIPSLDNVTLADSSTIEIFNDFMRANIDFKVE